MLAPIISNEKKDLSMHKKRQWKSAQNSEESREIARRREKETLRLSEGARGIA